MWGGSAPGRSPDQVGFWHDEPNSTPCMMGQLVHVVALGLVGQPRRPPVYAVVVDLPVLLAWLRRPQAFRCFLQLL